MHAVGANTGGQVGSVMAAAIMLSMLKGMGIIPYRSDQNIGRLSRDGMRETDREIIRIMLGR